MEDFVSSEIRHAACPVCDGPVRGLFAVSGYELKRCRECRFAFADPTPSAEAIIGFYEEFGGHGTGSTASVERPTLDGVRRAEREYPNATLDAERIARALKGDLGGGAILDVGCGYGFFSRAALDAGFEVVGLEIARDERATAEAMLPEATVIASTFEDYEPDRQFDGVIMSQVLEHAREPGKWLEKARRLTREGGMIAVALPNFNSITANVLGAKDPLVTPPAHLNYFSRANLEALMRRTGWEPVRSETLTRMPVTAFTRRFGNRPGRAMHAIATRSAFPLIDAAGKGTFLNMYGRAV